MFVKTQLLVKLVGNVISGNPKLENRSRTFRILRLWLCSVCLWLPRRSCSVIVVCSDPTDEWPGLQGGKVPCKEVLVDCALASPSTLRGRVHQGALRRMRQVLLPRVLVRSLPIACPPLQKVVTLSKPQKPSQTMTLGYGHKAFYCFVRVSPSRL